MPIEAVGPFRTKNQDLQLEYQLDSLARQVRLNTIEDEVHTLANDATPSVRTSTLWRTGGTTTITDFDDGVVGKTIQILADHSITITDNSNILLSGTTNFNMTPGDTLTLTMFDDQVWQEISRNVR